MYRSEKKKEEEEEAKRSVPKSNPRIHAINPNHSQAARKITPPYFSVYGKDNLFKGFRPNESRSSEDIYSSASSSFRAICARVTKRLRLVEVARLAAAS